jgi:uroporphyrinogen-III decarboxylase
MTNRTSLRSNFGGNCRSRSDIAADFTITAVEQLGVDAAIILSHLLLPLTPMGLAFGQGIVPETCVEKVIHMVKGAKEAHSNKEK